LKKSSIGFPGPGAYNSELVSVRSTTNTVIGTSKRIDISSQGKMPGPQDYNIKSNFEKDYRTMAVMRSYCGSSNLKSLKMATPGVGSYDVMKSTDFTRTKGSAFKIGKSKRKDLSSSPKNFPGPATYRVDDLNRTRQYSPRPFIGTSQREILNRTINWPGPGAYNTIRDFSATPQYQKITMSGRNSSASSDGSPGPIYNTINADRWTKCRNPSFKIGTGPKLLSTIKKDSNKLPGPGSYSFVESYHKMQIKFPSSKRKDMVNNRHSPGPGHYKVPCKFNELQSY